MRISGNRQLKHRLTVLLTAALTVPLLTSSNDHLTLLEQAQQRGSLTLLTRNGASSYFIGPKGGAGPEYDFAAAYANYLNLELKVK